jgi:hypothetical protein
VIQALWKRYAGVPFQWGSFDCVIFVAQYLDSTVGGDYEVRVRERFQYSTGLQAARIVRRTPGGLAALACEFLGEPVQPLCVKPGGIVMANVLGVHGVQFIGVKASNAIVAPAKRGLFSAPLDVATLGWNLPCPQRS